MTRVAGFDLFVGSTEDESAMEQRLDSVATAIASGDSNGSTTVGKWLNSAEGLTRRCAWAGAAIAIVTGPLFVTNFSRLLSHALGIMMTQFAEFLLKHIPP